MIRTLSSSSSSTFLAASRPAGRRRGSSAVAAAGMRVGGGVLSLPSPVGGGGLDFGGGVGRTGPETRMNPCHRRASSSFFCGHPQPTWHHHQQRHKWPPAHNPCRHAALSYSSSPPRATATGSAGSGSGSSSSSPKVVPFLLADIGEGIAEVELMQWFVQEGDHLRQFDRVCEVQSDKATVEITSRFDGRVKALEHQVGDMVRVGQPLLLMEGTEDADGAEDGAPGGGGANYGDAGRNNHPPDDEQLLRIPTVASRYHFPSDDDPTASVRAAPGGDGDGDGDASPAAPGRRVLTSPATRKLGREHGLDLSTIVGSGPQGRVSKGDVLTVLKERGLVETTTPSSRQASPAGAGAAAGDDAYDGVSVASPSPPSPPVGPSESVTSIDQLSLPLQQDTVLPLRGYSRLMASTMTASLQIPHMVYADEVNLTKFLKYKRDHQVLTVTTGRDDDDDAGRRRRLAFLPFAVKAVSKALDRHPLLNSSYDAESNHVTLWRDHNIGIAMDTPRGLIVPVLKRVQDRSLPDLADELRRLKEAASRGAIPQDDLRGATFTLSNIGSVGGGGTYMCPVVTPPQVAIGALGRIQRLPRYSSTDTAVIEEAHICVVSWGGDHRVVDGATMARFHSQWKAYMEDPILLLMEMR